jgi:isopenicillin-N N-acyltransferase like protein
MARGGSMVKLSKKMMAGMVLTMLLITIAALPYNTQPVEAEPSDIIATYGKGYLRNITGLLVLHVKGTPYEMGYQHGFLLKDRVQTIAQHVVQQMINMGYSYEYMINCAQAMEPHIPQEYIEEMEGLADGASMNYTDVFLTQIENSIQYYGHGWTGCSGFVVFGNATSDGHLYHGRSVDVSLCTVGSIGLVTVYEPENGNTFVNVGQIGIIGAHTGMNTEGITVEDNLSYSTNKTLDGMPVNFMLRKVLQYSNNLTHAIDIISQTDRTQGYNILLGDGRNLDGAAVEVSHDYCKVFWAGDPAENITPHYPIPNTVRRTNHYVDPELAATQRSPYAPIVGFGQSWDRYELLSQLIEGNYGNIDAQMSIEFLRTPPVAWAAINLQSMVFDSTNLELWVADSAFNTPAYLGDFIYVSHDDLFPEYTLTISSTAGGNVVTPGVGNFTYDEGTVVNLVATPNASYRFVCWTGDVETIANVSAATTNITMSGDYTITANFEDYGGVGCFIATAAYGTPMAPQTQILRDFRDQYLLTNPLGQAFVSLYYSISPPMANFIIEHPRLKPIVRAGLVPAVALSTIVVDTTLAEKIAVLVLLMLISVAVTIWATRRRGTPHHPGST